MVEREIPQSVRDAQEAELRAEEFFGQVEWAVVLNYVLGIGFLLLDRKFYVAPLAAAALAIAVGAFEAAEQHYKNKREQRLEQIIPLKT